MKYIIHLILIIVCTACSTYKKIQYDFDPTLPSQIERHPRVALVLGGGGAKGFAHIGVLEVLEEANIKVDLIVGTSAGSIVGALYADNPDAKLLKAVMLPMKKDQFLDISLLSIFNGASSLKGSVDGSVGEKFLEKMMSTQEFSELKIPFVAVATDINTGETVGLRSGRVAPAVRASYSIPGLFSPVEMFGMMLVDGGVSAPVAVNIAKQYEPELIIAVDITTQLKHKDVKNMINLVYRCAQIAYHTMHHEIMKGADVVIKPNVANVGTFDDLRNYEMYVSGRTAAIEQLDEIRRRLDVLRAQERVVNKKLN